MNMEGDGFYLICNEITHAMTVIAQAFGEAVRKRFAAFSATKVVKYFNKSTLQNLSVPLQEIAAG